MKQEYFDAKVTSIIDETPVVKRYYFRVTDTVVFDYKPGQFVMIDLPIQHKFTYRSYSIASAPTGNNEFELCIVLKPDGAATPYLFENVKEGDTVKTTLPLGKFVLPDQIETDLFFIATGTGIAPLRAMILDIYNKNIPHKNIYLYFGNRKVGDILYRKEFEELATEHPEFKFVPVLSRETPETWDGAIGYVHQEYEKHLLSKPPAMIYICGWSNMVREARDKLKEVGYSRAELKFELYD